MPLFIDVHNHIEGAATVFCLIAAPSREAAIAVHREAHGLVADDLTEVTEGR
jgi:Protein of unknown function (DUF4242)